MYGSLSAGVIGAASLVSTRCVSSIAPSNGGGAALLSRASVADTVLRQRSPLYARSAEAPESEESSRGQRLERTGSISSLWASLFAELAGLGGSLGLQPRRHDANIIARIMATMVYLQKRSFRGECS